ncbi:class I adenylate-forming enzyme family protein [Nocardia sp. NPDC050630]|uniref:class I adenylate-forming enzyme family protein n=1 Tax=Nocardia sp. NPDC050630 TaxID=3364321 RepID=UPI0037A30794
MASNLVQLLLEQSQQRRDLVIGTVDDQIRLVDALEIAAGAAGELTAQGVDRRGRVALVASNSTEYLIAWMSCMLAGVPVALVNRSYPPDLLATMLDRLEPAAVITDREEVDFAEKRRVLPLHTVRSARPSNPQALPGAAATESDIASFMHTSGTTGVPKFCAQTHGYFLRLGRDMAAGLGLTSTDRMLAPLPLFHINPLGYGLIGALSVGADALTVDRFSARGFWPMVKEHRITALVLHAPPVEILKRVTTGVDADGHEVRTMFYADAEFMSRFGISRAVSGYGSTEAAGLSHLHRWELGDEIPLDCGRYGLPRVDIEDRIDESGQIHIRERRQNVLFAGYYDNEIIDPSIDADGWFATGDLGRRAADGTLIFIERAAESIRVKGEFVPIPFVEGQLGTITALRDLALWKRPGEIIDEEIVLYVVADPVPMEAIREVSAGLPAFMRPAHVAQVRSIPRDAAAGKVQRRLLHDQELLSWAALTW